MQIAYNYTDVLVSSNVDATTCPIIAEEWHTFLIDQYHC